MSLLAKLSRFLGRRPSGQLDPLPPRRRVRLDAEPPLVYAVGDVHGCLDKLLEIERWILGDAVRFGRDPLVLMIGDYVDRGPQVRGVVEHLMAEPPAGLRRLCLAGNHEEVLANLALGRLHRDDWASFGLRETLVSYGIPRDRQPGSGEGPGAVAAALRGAIPSSHLEWMLDLPVLVETPAHIYVHAGVRPGLPMDRQIDRDLLWIRKDFLRSPEPADRLVIHGHTPVSAVEPAPGRINIDTNAARGGPLSAIRIVPGEPYGLLQIS